MTFAEEIRLGIPDCLPEPMPYDNNINHAPKRKEILTDEEKKLAQKKLHDGNFKKMMSEISGK